MNTRLNYLFIFFLSGILHSSPCKFFLIPVPKSGTHMMTKCLTFLTGKQHLYAARRKGEKLINFIETHNKNYFCHAHRVFNTVDAKLLREHNFKIIFMIRDPRDYVVSLAHYMKTIPQLWPHAQTETIDNLMFEIIRGSNRLQRELGNLNEYYGYLLPWIESPDVCVIRFEDLIGSQGGGSDEIQKQEIKKIAQHINVDVTNEKIQYIADNLFGNTATFRKGQIGNWKNYFTSEHKKIFKQIAGQLLIDLEYETDFEW